MRNISNKDLTACLRFGVRQCTYFNDYMFDTHIVSSYKDKVNFIYTKNDRWCPEKTIELLKPISKYKEVALPHDFILRKDERLQMIDEIMSF